MADLYDLVETLLMWGAVALAIGVVIYLAYLQYRNIKRARSRRRHHGHRSRRHRTGSAEHHPQEGDASSKANVLARPDAGKSVGS